MVISQGEVWWADFGIPSVTATGYTRPVVVAQCDEFNQSAISSVVCVPLTSNSIRAGLPGNVLLPAALTGLPTDSVANVAQVLAVRKAALRDRVGKLPRKTLELIFSGLDIVLGR